MTNHDEIWQSRQGAYDARTNRNGYASSPRQGRIDRIRTRATLTLSIPWVSVRACPSRALAITSQRGTVRAGSLNSFDVQVEPLPEPENAPLFHEAFSTSLCCHLRSDPLIATITVVWGSGEIRREAQSPSK